MLKLSSLLIGLSGKPRSGKDTVATMLEQAFPGIHRTNFSHAIADEYDAMHGTNTRHDEEEKVKHRHGFGSLANKRREEDPHYWVHRTLDKPKPLIVAGVRGVGEAEAIRQQGGILIKVEISPEKLQERMGHHYHDPAHHVAEHHLDGFTDWDYVIENNGSLADLSQKVEEVIADIKRRLQ